MFWSCMISFLTSTAKKLRHYLAKVAKNAKESKEHIHFLGDLGVLCEKHFFRFRPHQRRILYVYDISE